MMKREINSILQIYSVFLSAYSGWFILEQDKTKLLEKLSSKDKTI